MEYTGQAVIEDEAIVIRIPLGRLQQVVDGAWGLGSLDCRFKVTDAAVFAENLVEQLNSEDEAGTTLVHRMLDSGINEALEQGAEGIDEHEDQQDSEE